MEINQIKVEQSKTYIVFVIKRQQYPTKATMAYINKTNIPQVKNVQSIQEEESFSKSELISVLKSILNNLASGHDGLKA